MQSPKPIKLQRNIEQHAWDGAWYRRAYFDNGEPLGSATNPECQIDSLPQSWSVLSRASDKTRARARRWTRSMTHLVKRDLGVIQLFDPPFDKSHLNPGYIKGYVPGVRENGGQYTHAAVWAVMAFAAAGDTRTGVGAVRAHQPHPSRQHTEAPSHVTKSSPTSSPPMSTPIPSTPAAADGPGTPARRGGCIA